VFNTQFLFITNITGGKNNMASRKNGLTVSISPKRGLHVYWTKDASKYNTCIGDKIRGGTYANRAAVKAAFESAVASCAGASSSTMRKAGIARSK